MNLKPEVVEQLERVLSSVEQLLPRAVEPIAVEVDEMSELHPGLLAALKESGLAELMVPADYGGRLDRLDPLAICLVREVLMGTSANADSLFAMQGIGSYAITAAGSPEQRHEWLPRVARAEALPALALTEPEAGSDLKSIKTELVPGGGGLVLRGAKSFISNGAAASFFEVFAREEAGFTMVLVPADAPGITVTPTPELIAPHVLGEITFDDVELPPDCRLGRAGEGLQLVLGTLGVFRVSVAGAAVGLAQAALEEAVRHTRTRVQFGRPLARLGPVAQLLADSWTEIEMARLLTYRAAWLKDNGLAHAAAGAKAKLYASAVARRQTAEAVQILGGYGFTKEFPVERYYRDAKVTEIYEGTSEIQRIVIARGLLRDSL